MNFVKRNSSGTVIIAIACFFTAIYNFAFFGNVVVAFPPGPSNWLFYLSLSVLLVSVSAFFLGLVLNRFTFKPILMVLFPCAAAASYFMNTYNVVIDTTMIQNVFATDSRETRDLFSIQLLVYLVLLGVLPAFVIYRLQFSVQRFRAAFFQRLQFLTVVFFLIAGNIFLMGAHYTSFIREHKVLRYYTNPLTFVYSAAKYVDEQMSSKVAGVREPIGRDARLAESDKGRDLIILVLGEATRADRWSLNGYPRATNRELSKYDVVSFQNMYSCGTSTAYSLPCMFSAENTHDFSVAKAGQEENLLDVLQHAGINVLWRDNNSDSKGVAENIVFQDFRSPQVNPVCDIECRDIGMLSGLNDYIDSKQGGDIVIVLHQMGNHGPAYYKRYPQEFELFTPTCKTNQLENCNEQEISNAYDNAVAYSDFFLAKVIEFLKPRNDEFATAMFYMSDHGESLGEHGLYLHGLPYLIAPENQKHVAALMWFGDSFKQPDPGGLYAQRGELYSHDNYFHTVLGMLEVETSLYRQNMDILNPRVKL